MPIFRSAHYSHRQVTATAIDQNSGLYLWIGFEKDTDDNCRILKVSANDLNQIYFDVDLEVNAIKKMYVKSTNLIVAVDHASNYLYRYAVSNPLSTPAAIARPAGVNEAPVAFADDGTYLWWLFPGESAEIAKIIKTTSIGTFQQTITLEQSGDEIHNAISITYRDGDLWVVTNESPANLVRVHLVSGIWTLNVTPLVTT
jgi:hypothetical protein